MKISEILKKNNVSISFEIFPPKKDSAFDSVMNTALSLANLKPDFMSITCGAGGTTQKNTEEIAIQLQQKGNVTSIAHLTCIGATKEHIQSVTNVLKQNNIKNIFALRGDFPPGTDASSLSKDFSHASDLVKLLKASDDFCVGGACYPEGHPESKNRDEDLDLLRYKVDAGCDFLTTQMFFDNDMLYNFLYQMQSKGIHVPVLAGIMPITHKSQISKMISLSNAYMPRKLLTIIDKYADSPEALMQAGIAYATDQIIDLITNNIPGIHIYTMNKPDVASSIMKNISSIVDSVNNRTINA